MEFGLLTIEQPMKIIQDIGYNYIQRIEYCASREIFTHDR